MFEQLGLIGCGLMAAPSRCAQRAAGQKRLVGYSKSPSHERAAACVIDVEAPSALLAVSGATRADCRCRVFRTEATFKAIRTLVSPHTLIMDSAPPSATWSMPPAVLAEHIGSFVPGTRCRPRSLRVEHADPDLYSASKVILTPIDAPRPPAAASR